MLLLLRVIMLTSIALVAGIQNFNSQLRSWKRKRKSWKALKKTWKWGNYLILSLHAMRNFSILVYRLRHTLVCQVWLGTSKWRLWDGEMANAERSRQQSSYTSRWMVHGQRLKLQQRRSYFTYLKNLQCFYMLEFSMATSVQMLCCFWCISYHFCSVWICSSFLIIRNLHLF